MKHTHTSLVTLFIGVMAAAGFSQTERPIVMTRPAIQDGSNASRAPIPAARQFDDVKAPDGQAVDQIAPSTNIEPAIPPARVAVLQGATAPAYAATTTTTYTEPALTPTGRTTVIVAPPAAPVAVEVRSAPRAVQMQAPAIHDGSNWSRAPLPAKREFNDVKGPDGQAIDQLPEVPDVKAR